ncbi:unnamed protein product [Adineta steineri]|uniref:Uncharacterized protein n=1 Tax=Adineta steineri TaxID=433720 RepID=A0A820N632_9BILA|nr:unnamed protein product [Adineta steineri]
MFLSTLTPLLLLLILLLIYQTNGTNLTFIPQSIHITTADLPQPNTSLSVTKTAQIIPVPSDPYVLLVQLYQEDLYIELKKK